MNNNPPHNIQHSINSIHQQQVYQGNCFASGQTSDNNSSFVPLNKFGSIFQKYQISNQYWDDLKGLTNLDIVIIGDDSGSMKTPIKGGETRWDELRQVMYQIIEIGTSLDSDGVDILFLNRQGRDNVTYPDQVSDKFLTEPKGVTPLTNTIMKALQKKKSKPMLLVIATDGVPTDSNGYPDIDSFKSVLKKKPNDVYVSIFACSDSEKDIGYLNKLDKKIQNLDVLSDYVSKLNEVKSIQGNNASYSFGDHIARLLIGPTSSKYDKIDEIKRVYE
jgi:hypothetical protein